MGDHARATTLRLAQGRLRVAPTNIIPHSQKELAANLTCEVGFVLDSRRILFDGVLATDSIEFHLIAFSAMDDIE